MHVCVRCGNEAIAYFYEGRVARDVEVDKDIIARWRVDELILEKRFIGKWLSGDYSKPAR